jgi:hypothetical protein
MPAIPVLETRVSNTAVGFSGVLSTTGCGCAQPATPAATAMTMRVRMTFSQVFGLQEEASYVSARGMNQSFLSADQNIGFARPAAPLE